MFAKNCHGNTSTDETTRSVNLLHGHGTGPEMRRSFQGGKSHICRRSSQESSTDTASRGRGLPHGGRECRRVGQGSQRRETNDRDEELEPSDRCHSHDGREASLQRRGGWLVAAEGRCGSVAQTNLWYQVQESVPWERPHCQAYKQLQDERVGLLAGVEEDEADAEHGAQRDERDSGRAVAIFCQKKTV